MSKYTTGEIAKACDVSVRTVQYYDTRGILIPSELSEGGRRLYSEEDLDRMKLICFLRDMGFSIDHIATLFADDTSQEVISTLIERQRKALEIEVKETQKKLDRIDDMKHALKNVNVLSVETLGDVANMMKNRRKRRRMLSLMLIIGIVMDIVEIGTLIFGCLSGIWWPMLVGFPIAFALGLLIGIYYIRHVSYICPSCHKIFEAGIFGSFWEYHTPTGRRLTCPHCQRKSFCVEIYREKNAK